MTTKDFMGRYGFTRPTVDKYISRGRWTMPDGATWTAKKHGGKWVLNVETQTSQESKRGITPEQLKAKKTYEEIRLLQNRNERMRAELLRDWNEIIFRSISKFLGELITSCMALKLDAQRAKKLDGIIRKMFSKVESLVNEEMEAFEDENKAKLR